MVTNANEDLLEKRISLIKKSSNKFGLIADVLMQKHNNLSGNLDSLVNYQNKNNGNVVFIPTSINKQGMLQLAKEKIYQSLIAKTKVAISLITHDPVNVSSLNLSNNQILSNLSTFGNVCPVSLKIHKN